jgi:protein involved in polysaccharide export with SLBB domain
MRLTRRRFFPCWAVLCLAATPVAAQVFPGSPPTQQTGTQNPLDALRSRYGAASSAGSSLALEGALDPDEYVVGPGDLFAILIRGLETSAAPVAVSADGRLPLPDAGSLAVADLTLSAARDSIVQALLPAFGRTRIEVTLVQPRSFFVHVTGAVPTPGRYQAAPAARVSTALEMAFADTSRAAVLNRSLRPGFRNVSVVRRDGSELSVDLRRYFSGGSTTHNPYLRDGDVVVVTAYDPAYESVRIDGAVPFPGSYDARPEDTLADLLAVAGVRREPGFDALVRLTRMSDGGSVSIDAFRLAEALEGPASAIPVHARDHVSVEPASLPGGVASIDGWVFHPGTYPIVEGRTTVRELLERAGGLREDALTSGAYVVRAAPLRQNPDAGMPDSRFAGMPDLSALVAADSMAFLQRMRLTELSIVGRMHFALAYRYQNRVPVDVEGMLEGRVDPLVLRDGDRLVIPRDQHSVYVFGQVLRPGFVAFEPDRTLADYVEMAGGTGPNAGAVMLLRNLDGELIEDPGAPVRSGDLVFVDRENEVTESLAAHQAATQDRQAAAQDRQVAATERQVELAAEQSRRDSRYQLASTILSAVSSIGTMIALIISLRRN